MRIVAPIFLLLSLNLVIVADEGWNQFRGSVGGRLPVVEHPLEWAEHSNIAWAVPMKGSGWSSPLVLGDRIYLTSAVSEGGDRPKGMAAGVASMRSFRNAKPDKHDFNVSCYDLNTGEELWSKTVGEMVPPVVHPSNTYATESPATDGERIITLFATTGTLVGWDPDGNELWRQELGNYKSGNGFGTGSSLAILDNRVFVQFDNDENSFVAAYNTETGEQLWRNDRPGKTSWSTPMIWEHSGRKELVTCGSDVVTAYDPADGTVVWQLSGMKSGFSGSPAIDADRIYFGTSGPMSAGPLVAVKAGTEGEIELDRNFESEKVAWSRTRSGPGMASPVVANGHLFITGSSGILNCYDTETGERVYKKRVSDMKTVVASLWADEERVFILDENGTTHVIAAGPEFNVLGTNQIDDLVWSTPTVAGDSLIIRGVEKLYCIRQ